MNPTEQAVIFFADVAGSTKLYERLGDQAAHQCITATLSSVGKIIDAHAGRIIEIIGDEIMACFDATHHAVSAACDIQEAVRINADLAGMRIGFMQGSVSFDNDHPYGDTVNTASRLSELAQEGKIITTQETIADSQFVSNVNWRNVGLVSVRGKMRPLEVVEVIWDEDDATCLRATPLRTTALPTVAEHNTTVVLTFGGRERRIDASYSPFTIGRGADCDLVVAGDMASRSHLTLKMHLYEWFIVDHSTNGTYLSTPSGKRSYDGLNLRLHHSERVIAGSGRIGLGEPIGTNTTNTVAFSVISNSRSNNRSRDNETASRGG